MAGDWIKFEKATLVKPEVLRMASLLSIHRYQVVGACLAFWSWCDEQLQTCHARGVTEKMIDDIVGIPDFASALLEVGWLHSRNGSIEVPNFDRHLSESAKTRSLSNKRKAKSRNAVVPKMSRSERDKSVTREEKRREEKREVIPTESCTEPPPASAVPPPVMTIPVSGGGQAEWPVTAEKVAEWSEAYPGVDVLAELRKARQWCIDNPTRRKTLRGVANFCNTWLNKAQNQTRGEPRGLNGTTIRGPAGTAPTTTARRSSGTITQADIDALNARTIRTGTPEPDAAKTAHTAGQTAQSVFGAEEGEAGDQSGVSW